MIRFLNAHNVPQADGTRRHFRAGAIVNESELPAEWTANALQRGSVEQTDPPAKRTRRKKPAASPAPAIPAESPPVETPTDPPAELPPPDFQSP